jgi:hypothetical protein
MASARLRGHTWTGYWREDGKQKTLGGFPTEKSALDHALLSEALARPRRAVEVHPVQKRGKITVAAYAPEWLETQILEETSHETYQRTADRIIKHPGGMAREDVTPDDVRRMLMALKKSGLRDATIAATLDLARGLLGKQACADVRYRIKDRREMMAVTRSRRKPSQTPSTRGTGSWSRLRSTQAADGANSSPSGGPTSSSAARTTCSRFGGRLPRWKASVSRGPTARARRHGGTSPSMRTWRST